MARQHSVSELARHAKEVVAEASLSKEPIFISQNGHATALLVDADTYLSQMQTLDEFLRIYRREADIRPVRR